MATRLRGFERVRRAMGVSQETMVGAVAAALYQAGTGIIMRQAKRIVPVRTGRLKGTGIVGRPRHTRAGPVVRLGFGTNYGLAVHETHRTKSKFLKIPIDRARRGWTNTIKRLAVRNIQRGTIM